MFRTIISNLSFSPALVGQLGFYAKRLRKEEATRRLGLIFTALALIVQSLAVFSPPEAANAASAADFIAGGVTGKKDFLAHYDNNTNRIQGLFKSLGITRQEVTNMQTGSISAAGVAGKYNWSRTSLYSAAQGQRSYTFNNGAGNVTFYYRPLSLTASKPPYSVLVGKSAAFGWFAIKLDCGNLITKTPPPTPEPEAACVDLAVVPITPTRFLFKARASKQDGAVIYSYTYRVTNASGVKVAEIVNRNSKLTDQAQYTRTVVGKYKVQLSVKASTGIERASSCVGSFTVAAGPVAACSNVVAAIENRTTVSLSGSSIAQNGATIKGYTFVVKDSKGIVVKNIGVSSTSLQATAPSFIIETPGSYSVTLTVSTSVGNVTNSTTCVKNFTIAKKEVCQYNPTLPPNSPDCQPCPGSPNIWIKDEKCAAEVINTKMGTNMTQGNVEASTVTARSGDKLSYTLSIENKGLASKSVTISENLEDVLEYSTLVDQAGGQFNSQTKTITWGSVVLEPGQKQSRTIAVQMLSPLPATNTGTSNSESYDCKMINTFGNSVTVKVDCAPEKVIVEQVVGELPKTGPGENMLFASLLLSVVVYFYARSRQLGTEVRLVRRNLNTGTV